MLRIFIIELIPTELTVVDPTEPYARILSGFKQNIYKPAELPNLGFMNIRKTLFYGQAIC